MPVMVGQSDGIARNGNRQSSALRMLRMAILRRRRGCRMVPYCQLVARSQSAAIKLFPSRIAGTLRVFANDLLRLGMLACSARAA